MKRVAALLGDALREERRVLARALWSGVFVALSTIGLTATSAWLIVRAAQHPVILSLTVPMGLVQLFALAKAAGRYVERTQTHHCGLSVMGRIRARVAVTLEALLPAGLGPTSASAVETVLGDVERVQDLLTAVAQPLIVSSVAGVVTVVVAACVVPLSGLVLLGGLVIVGLGISLVAARSGEVSEGELEAVRAELVEVFTNATHAGAEYELLGASERLHERIDELENRFDEASKRRARNIGVATMLSTLVSGLTVILVVVATASTYRHHGVAQALLAVPALASVTALELLGGTVPLLVSARRDRGALERIEALSDVTPPVRAVAFSGEPVGADLVSTNVHFSYEDREVLHDLNFSLVPGDVVLLRGASGEGKTTLAQLLVKFLEATSGGLSLGGVSYDELSGETVRSVVGFVDDDPYVFDTTLAGNLRIAEPRASEVQLLAACEAAGLGNFVAALPDGLGSSLGGIRRGLSGGEQRRLGIARQLLAPKSVLVLDEPTEGLDEATAAQVMTRLVSTYAEGVILLISHREADAQYANKVWELRSGTLTTALV